ncbi:MAG: TIGR00269 family protein [archaeon]|nr:TIGR00269 family protein [Nanoarchaeota archaeon]
MKCNKCEHKAVITLQHGSLCKQHFINYFEDKVFKTINKYQLIQRNDKVCVAASGGKDSLTALYLTQKYLKQNNYPNQVTALIINEGINNYRDKTLDDLKQFCNEHNIPLTIASFQEEYGKPLDEAYPIINKTTGKKPCNICGVWRRQLINKHAKLLNATKLVTGHNLDDESQVIVMNMFKANTSISAKLGPISGIEEHQDFVRRIKPLYFCTEKETRLYALLKKFKVEFTECPYVTHSYRAEVREMLNQMEEKYPGTKTGIINSFLDILPLLKERELNKPKTSKPNVCKCCQEPSKQEICNACKLKEELKC